TAGAVSPSAKTGVAKQINVAKKNMAKTLFLTRIHLLSTSQHVSMNKGPPLQEATEGEKGEEEDLLEGSQTTA
ncbi:hypothetical protein MUP01_02180, partial [Candidatus Bathyarchaeota archaeon]|nr:hypothetical protein [Candidatus Bathyarchaeota archaeon]